MSNPVDSKSPRGRPKKKGGFRGTPKQENTTENNMKLQNQSNHGQNINFNIVSNVRDAPLGLSNIGENVCFFNSVIQILYSIPAFQEFIRKLPPVNEVVSTIRDLFAEISTSNVPVRTSRYLQNIGLTNYVFGMQYDAHECFLQLLNKIYPVINDNCMFKVVMLEVTVCENTACNHTLNKTDTGVDLSLNIKDSEDVQTINGNLDDLQNPHVMLLSDYRCDRCNIIGTSSKAVCITHLSDVLIIQLCIFKFRNGVIKKLRPTLHINEEISLWGNTMTLHAIICHEGELANSGHYTSNVKVNDQWYLISDSFVTQQQPQLTYTKRDASVPYILIYKKKINVITCLPNSSNYSSDNNHALSTTQVYTGLSSEIMNRQLLLKELDKQKERINIADEKRRKGNASDRISVSVKQLSQIEGLSKVKSPVKRKLKFRNDTSSKRVRSFRDNLGDSEKKKRREDAKNGMKKIRDNFDHSIKEKIKDSEKKRMKEMRDNIDDAVKEKSKDSDKKKKKEMRDNIDDAVKEKIKDSDKKKKKEMRDNIDDAVKEKIKDSDKKKKKEMRDNIDDAVKEKIKDSDKKKKKEMRDNFDDAVKEKIKDSDKKKKKEMRDNIDDAVKEKIKDSDKKKKKEMRDNIDDAVKEKIKDSDKKKKKEMRDNKKNERYDIFKNVQTCSMVDPSILHTTAFSLIEEEFKNAIQEGPIYVCDICWKFEYKRNMIKLKDLKYDKELYEECHTGKSEMICKGCHNSLLKNKMPMQAQANLKLI